MKSIMKIPILISVGIHSVLISLIIYLSFYPFTESNNDTSGENISLAIYKELTVQTGTGKADAELKRKYFGTFLQDNDSSGEWLYNPLSLRNFNYKDYRNLAQANSLMKDLNSKRKRDNNNTGILSSDSRLRLIKLYGINFSFPFDHKLKTETEMILDSIYNMISYREPEHVSSRERRQDFTSAVIEYLKGEKGTRSWKTLWLVKNAATEKEKLDLLNKICRLYTYCLYHEEPDAVRMRGTVEDIIRLMPDELKKDALNCVN